MKARIFKFVKWFLLIWGGISFITAVYIAIWFGRVVLPTPAKIDSASPHDVSYVLDGCHFGGKQIERVVHSYIGSHGLLDGGDVDAFAIKISNIDEADFVPKKDHPNEHWFRGDQLPPVLDAAVSLVSGWHNRFPWFPTGAELRNPEVYVYPMDLYCCCGSVDPAMATLVFVRKTDNMMFYLKDRR